MAKVRMRTAGAGPGGPMPAGAVVDVSDEAAAELLAGGYAEAVEDNIPASPDEDATEPGASESEDGDWMGDAETATAEPPENAMKPPARRRTRG